MFTDLNHRIGIAAPADKVYKALTTSQGIKGWWTVDVKMEDTVRGHAVFGFDGQTKILKMRIEQLEPGALVQWKCVEGTPKQWVGTTQEFRIVPQADGSTLLKLCHGCWKDAEEFSYACNTQWGHLLMNLKQYAEKGVKQPYFT